MPANNNTNEQLGKVPKQGEYCQTSLARSILPKLAGKGNIAKAHCQGEYCQTSLARATFPNLAGKGNITKFAWHFQRGVREPSPADTGAKSVGSQQQAALQYLERHLAAQVGHVLLREGVGRAATRELRERAREHAAVAPVHLLRYALRGILTHAY